MSNEPTPDEVERAKKWAAMQTPPVTVVEFPKWERRPQWSIEPLPSFLNVRRDYYTPLDAWYALTVALRPVFASVAPVVREEMVVELRRILRAQHDATVHPHNDDIIKGQKHACIGIDHEIYERWVQK